MNCNKFRNFIFIKKGYFMIFRNLNHGKNEEEKITHFSPFVTYSKAGIFLGISSQNFWGLGKERAAKKGLSFGWSQYLAHRQRKG